MESLQKTQYFGVSQARRSKDFTSYCEPAYAQSLAAGGRGVELLVVHNEELAALYTEVWFLAIGVDLLVDGLMDDNHR